MATATEGRTVTKRNDVSVKVDSEAVRIARNVATYEGIPLAEYLSRVIEESASRRWQEILDEEQKRLGSKGKKSK